MAFCLLQQVGLNSFLTNRLLGAFEKPWIAAVVAGISFGALHWPNPVLVPLTLVGGIGMAWLFARERNILPLTVGQAILGSAGVVGVSAGMAPLDESGARVLELSFVIVRKIENTVEVIPEIVVEDFATVPPLRTSIARSPSRDDKQNLSGFVAADQAVGDEEKQFAIGVFHASDERVDTMEKGGPLPDLPHSSWE